jgi:alpha-glucoside transport system permease protein
VIAARLRHLALHLTALALMALWLLPVAGLVTTSLRSADQAAASGWWRAVLVQQVHLPAQRLRGASVLRDGWHGTEGVLFDDATARAQVLRWGTSSRAPQAYPPGATVTLEGGARLQVRADGGWRLSAPSPLTGPEPRVFVTATLPPAFTLQNFRQVVFQPLAGPGLGRALANTALVAIPATVIPLTLATLAAYALVFMAVPGRAVIGAAVAGLMAVPLQVALVPLLQLHNQLGIGKGLVGVWLAHTGFGLPLAILVLRSAMARLPSEVIDAARLDGARDWQILTRIVLPMVFPTLAGLAALQFLWTWNDLLVALVFLGSGPDQQVMTATLLNRMGTHGGQWPLLAAAAVVSMVVPLAVFAGLQRYLTRGLAAGLQI